MKTPAIFLIPALTVTACQGCRNTPPVPAPQPSAEAGTTAEPADASSEAGPADAGGSDGAQTEAGVPDAGPSAPVNPCWRAIIGPANAFCEGDAPTVVAVEPRFPDSKKKLYFAMSGATARTRLVVRYANGSKTARFKTVVVLTNTGAAPAKFTLLKKGVAGPTTNLPEGESLAVGRWHTSAAKAPVQVATGSSVKFDPSLEVGLQEGYATMGLYEYAFDQSHQVHVCFVGPAEDSSVCAKLAP